MYKLMRASFKRRRNGYDGSPPPSSSHTRAQVRQALSGHIQAKLTVGVPNDAYEQEADRVASQVMNTPDGTFNAGHTGGQLQRQCTECGEENDGAMVQTLQRQPAEEEEEEAQPKLKQGEVRRQADEEDKEEEAVQAKSKTDPAHSSLNTTTAEQINSQRGRGVPLAQSERNFFEPRFGHDFSSVRIHTGADAAQSAEAIQAKAFTLGRDLFFNSGEYAPGTDTGRRLMAHELTHVVQQNTEIGRKGGGKRDEGNHIRPYRNSSSVNFGANDSTTMKEKSFNSKTPDPYIDKITVNFTGTVSLPAYSGSGKETVPKGTLSATYANNKASPMPSAINGVTIVGGYPSQGLTDKGSFKVHRIEGWGYHNLSVPPGQRVGSKWPKYKYFKPNLASGKASMSYALFFKGHEAIHLGGLNVGSLACVHFAAIDTMRQLNYHSRRNKTKVEVTYTAAALKLPCCERYGHTTRMVNPCNGQKSSKCKKTP